MLYEVADPGKKTVIVTIEFDDGWVYLTRYEFASLRAADDALWERSRRNWPKPKSRTMGREQDYDAAAEAVGLYGENNIYQWLVFLFRERNINAIWRPTEDGTVVVASREHGAMFDEPYFEA